MDPCYGDYRRAGGLRLLPLCPRGDTIRGTGWAIPPSLVGVRVGVGVLCSSPIGAGWVVLAGVRAIDRIGVGVLWHCGGEDSRCGGSRGGKCRSEGSSD